MGPFVFLVLVMTVKSAESVESDDPSPTFSENSVCQQQVITINPLVYSQSSPPLNSEIGCNSSTIQHMVETEQMVTRRQLEELQIAVSTNQKMITSALRNATHQFKDTTLQVQELLVSLSGFQENVTSEVLGIRRQLEQLQVLVSAFKEFLHDSSTVNQSSTTDATERTTSTETDSSTMNEASTTDATERITTTETDSSTKNQASTTDATERTTTTETDSSTMNQSSTTDATERITTTETDSSTMNQASTTDATERTTTTETDSSTMNQASTTDATERITTKETGSSTMNQASTTDATERTTTTETDAPPKDCSDILASGVSISGVYTVQPLSSGEAFQVYCDMETDGGGWTVFQRREDGSVDFYLDFASYSRGFGNLEGEFWLGNDNLHRLTAQGEYELRVDLSDFESESRFAKYDSFSIADVSGIYKLAVGSYSGTAGDSLSVQNNQPFSTKDRDNDAWYRSCAQTYHGAWWYRDCHFSNLNGEYLRGTTTVYARGAVWRTWRGYRYSLRTSEMKIRPTPQQ
ncbi:tenascin-R-like isoform X1 [Asterias rubens]|uniref:tenascin-R-like isoform X1 n=1 Tax=Asterias rubens TaxID=7604 RepID=UPI0014559BA7|nr:tenascin-R-like isoform X1 [Asterias rubens]